MRHMKNLTLPRVFTCLLVTLLGMLLLSPLGVQAREVVGRDDGSGGEGDPLDSNDFGTGGGGDGGGDSDIHDSLSAPPSDGIMRFIMTLLVDENGALVLPFFQNGVPVIQVVTFPEIDLTAEPHAD